MTCTTYNEQIGYNYPISYNGTCVTPVPGGGGFGEFSDVFYTPLPEDEEGVMIALLGLLEDDK